jgi:hypothetical protein
MEIWSTETIRHSEDERQEIEPTRESLKENDPNLFTAYVRPGKHFVLRFRRSDNLVLTAVFTSCSDGGLLAFLPKGAEIEVFLECEQVPGAVN